MCKIHTNEEAYQSFLKDPSATMAPFYEGKVSDLGADSVIILGAPAEGGTKAKGFVIVGDVIRWRIVRDSTGH